MDNILKGFCGDSASGPHNSPLLCILFGQNRSSKATFYVYNNPQSCGNVCIINQDIKHVATKWDAVKSKGCSLYNRDDGFEFCIWTMFSNTFGIHETIWSRY